MSTENPDATTANTTTRLSRRGWQLVVGSEARGVVDRKQLPEGVGEVIIDTAVSILSRGMDPGENPNHQTGLVVGYVQSGKTLSYTTVMALARDNGYRLVIAVTGTSTPLLNQSTFRLRNDLFVDDVDGYLRWTTFTNPTSAEVNQRSIGQVLDEWRDPQVPKSERPTVLITIMKNHRHLANLIDLLHCLNLDDVPTLIIDDEADQASLNTLVRRGRESTTYRRLLELREVVPKHTFLQYTATPQAPLLINIIDTLSPDFVEVLEPGEDYVGGRTFFKETHELVKTIPYDDVPTDDNPVSDPPFSLLDALRIFFVGVAAGLIQGRSRSNVNRSMLIHPSRKTAKHQEYRIWVGQIFDEWRQLISLPETNSDRIDFIEDFQDAYRELARTVPNLPTFDEIMDMLPRAFRLTNIEEVNTRGRRRTPTIDWARSYGWILIGGQSMDRGFTVEGLTVTYMPRGPGVGNADTIQQRGRFFGYKRPYLGFCRTYLEQDIHTAFEEYVEHEEEMRRQLQNLCDAGSPLSDWKRTFVLSPDLRPCRNNVIQYDYARGKYADAWFAPGIVLDVASVINENREASQTFLSSLTLRVNEGNPNREPAQIHNICQDVALINVVENLLLPYRLTASSDTQEITGVLLQLSHALEKNADEQCTVYQMSPDYSRRRAVDDNGKIRNLFQGAAPVDPPSLRGSVYPGDRKMHESENVTIQVHFVDLTQNEVVVAEAVPVIAVWVPRRMGLSWVTQNQQ